MPNAVATGIRPACLFDEFAECDGSTTGLAVEPFPMPRQQGYFPARRLPSFGRPAERRAVTVAPSAVRRMRRSTSSRLPRTSSSTWQAAYIVEDQHARALVAIDEFLHGDRDVREISRCDALETGKSGAGRFVGHNASIIPG